VPARMRSRTSGVILLACHNPPINQQETER
jgi:hypothetical protein